MRSGVPAFDEQVIPAAIRLNGVTDGSGSPGVGVSDRVVPVAVEVVAGERDGGKLLVGDLDVFLGDVLVGFGSGREPTRRLVAVISSMIVR